MKKIEKSQKSKKINISYSKLLRILVMCICVTLFSFPGIFRNY